MDYFDLFGNQARMPVNRKMQYENMGKGPVHETCRTCANSYHVLHNSRNFWKCKVIGFSRGAATDIRLNWSACSYWRV